METTEKNVLDQIKNISEYFEKKVIEGNFEFKKCDDHLAYITIDEKFDFCLWISNEPKEHFRFYRTDLMFKMSDFCFDTQKKRLAGWKTIKPYITDYKKNILLKAKQKELKELEMFLEKNK